MEVSVREKRSLLGSKLEQVRYLYYVRLWCTKYVLRLGYIQQRVGLLSIQKGAATQRRNTAGNIGEQKVKEQAVSRSTSGSVEQPLKQHGQQLLLHFFPFTCKLGSPILLHINLGSEYLHTYASHVKIYYPQYHVLLISIQDQPHVTLYPLLVFTN